MIEPSVAYFFAATTFACGFIFGVGYKAWQDRRAQQAVVDAWRKEIDELDARRPH